VQTAQIDREGTVDEDPDIVIARKGKRLRPLVHELEPHFAGETVVVVILGIFATVPIQGVKFARLEIDHTVCAIGLELHDVARCASGEPLVEPLLARVVPAIWAAGVVQGQNWFLIRIELF